MNQKLLAIAGRVVAKADRDRPADGVLRAALREQQGITRADGAEISRAVFTYYRWLGWLDSNTAVAARLMRAMDLDQAFRETPAAFSERDLQRAVPAWVAECVEVSEDWLRALQTEPILWLRARPGSGQQLAEKLGDCRAAGDGALADSLSYHGGKDLFRSQEFYDGAFELQDISSQMVGLMCGPQPGAAWWDACAGEGGKMLHLCDLMRNKGLVWASDRAGWRLEQLKRRAARAKVFNYRAVRWVDTAKPPTKTKFDGVLVDAPCSGLGTWQRNPHARWTTRKEDVLELAQVQRRLLALAVNALKPGGRLIYSVCTMTKPETVEVAAHIQADFPELKPLPLANPLESGAEPASQWMLWPQAVRGNAMFIGGWKREQ